MNELRIILLLSCGLVIAACGSKSTKAPVKKASVEDTKTEQVVESEDAISETEDTASDTYDYDYNSQDINDSEDSYYEEENLDEDYTEEYATPSIDEEEASQFMNKFKTIYEQLLTFKDQPEFHQYGFVQPGEYHDWMIEAQNLRDNPISNQLADRGLVTNELVLLGIQYLESKGQENYETMMFNEDFKKVLY